MTEHENLIAKFTFGSITEPSQGKKSLEIIWFTHNEWQTQIDKGRHIRNPTLNALHECEQLRIELFENQRF